jgi:hypothetical protein
MLKKVFGESRIGLKWIMEKAWELKRKLKYGMKLALLKAWIEVYRFYGEMTTQFPTKFRLFVDGNKVTFTSGVEEAITTAMEYIGKIMGKQEMYRISQKVYDMFDKMCEKLRMESFLQFDRNIYLEEA